MVEVFASHDSYAQQLVTVTSFTCSNHVQVYYQVVRSRIHNQVATQLLNVANSYENYISYTIVVVRLLST